MPPSDPDTAVDSAEAGRPGQGHGVHQFIGSWRLVSFETRTAAGQVIYPFGRDADGVLTYTRDRRMSATLWKAGRQPFAINGDRLELTTPPVRFGGTTLVASVSWRRM